MCLTGHEIPALATREQRSSMKSISSSSKFSKRGCVCVSVCLSHLCTHRNAFKQENKHNLSDISHLSHSPMIRSFCADFLIKKRVLCLFIHFLVITCSQGLLTFTVGVRIQPGLIKLAIVFLSPNYVCPAGEQKENMTQTENCLACAIFAPKGPTKAKNKNV